MTTARRGTTDSGSSAPTKRLPQDGCVAARPKEQFWGLVHGIWPLLKRDRRWDGRSLFGPPGQLAKREQPGTGNEEERRRVSIPVAGKGDVRMGV
ncbi:hypothetical protein DUI87_17660 [Hirundo rustica rustica]|uniref:Uncharacterized protein n=1 Tax=Hirundo rustica rustica TaxID=333673 RepID=A0A3M0JXN8_HIRRU|nr:hypothetical protein DUI87_17660 [Hirundo rustica rustica]